MEVELVIKVINELLVPDLDGVNRCIYINSVRVPTTYYHYYRHTFKFEGGNINNSTIIMICDEIKMILKLMGMIEYVNDVIYVKF
jgi:hypothetical protein